jgi:hypothetical protein
MTASARMTPRQARKRYEEREIRPTKRLTLAEVPGWPADAECWQHDGHHRAYDATLGGDPCRWRIDSKGIKVFIRYYSDHKTANSFPWKELYERGRTDQPK